MKKHTLVLTETQLSAIVRCVEMQQQFACIEAGKAAKKDDMISAVAYATDAVKLEQLLQALPVLI